MDPQTERYYAAHAAEIAARYANVSGGVDAHFAAAFAPGMRVLDVGAGSGRDVALLLAAGIDAYGVEPCAELRAEGLKRYPQLAGRLGDAGLPHLGQPFGGAFDGVLCSAVLMHVPREEVFASAFALRSVLNEGGTLLISVPASRPGIGADGRDDRGRLFTSLPEDWLELLFERLGFRLIQKWHAEDALARGGVTWCTLLFRLQYKDTARPVDQVEGVLTRDKKTATYKLALFRALSEIAATEFERATWV